MRPELDVSLLAAVARNRVIGNRGELPWHLRQDLQRFKRLTLGHPVVMGRKTWDSIVRRLGGPLPGRENIVVSRSGQLQAAGCSVADSLGQALDQAAALARGARVYVIGGAEIYRLALPLATRLDLTEIEADFEGDALFPPFERDEWQEKAREPHLEAGVPFSFVTYERRGR